LVRVELDVPEELVVLCWAARWEALNEEVGDRADAKVDAAWEEMLDVWPGDGDLHSDVLACLPYLDRSWLVEPARANPARPNGWEPTVPLAG
jgi:hypothetical protein